MIWSVFFWYFLLILFVIFFNFCKLWTEELEEKIRKEDETRILKQDQQKAEIMKENKIQILAKKEMMKRMEEEERELVQSMLSKFAVDEAAEMKKVKMNEETKHKFASEANKHRMQRAELIQNQKQKELQEGKEVLKQEEYRKFVIAEARKKLLLEHSTLLKGYLPKVSFSNSFLN